MLGEGGGSRIDADVGAGAALEGDSIRTGRRICMRANIVTILKVVKGIISRCPVTP